jgi:hypothetical protein
VLARCNTEWAAQRHPDASKAACQEAGSTSGRDRLLTPVTTTQLFLWQILHGHAACSHVPPLPGLRFSAAASGQARTTRPLDLLALLLARVCAAGPSHVADEGRWPGPRPVLVEGSGCSMPATPALQAAFGQPTEPRPGCGVPVARLVGVVHAGTGVLLTRAVAPRLTHALARMPAVHPSVQPGEVLVADRGLCASAPVALLVQASVQAVRCVGARQMVEVTPGRPFVRPRVRRTPAVTGLPRSRGHTAWGPHDPRVTWLQPKTRPTWLARETVAALPEAFMR